MAAQKHGEGNTYLPKLLLVNFLLLAYHHSHFLDTILDFTSFFLNKDSTLFYSWAVFD